MSGLQGVLEVDADHSVIPADLDLAPQELGRDRVEAAPDLDVPIGVHDAGAAVKQGEGLRW